MLTKKFYLIAILGTLLAVFWQELNLFSLNHQFPESNGLITCADESSYIRPAENLLKKGEWVANAKGEIAYFMRPPGFGIYYLFLTLVFGKKVWLGMKIFQIAFFFLSILLFAKTLNFIKLNEIFKLILVCLYAFFPCYSGFMYFTITESISPFFMILSSYFWLKTIRKNSGFPIGFILSSSFLILIRPQLLLFVLLFSIYLFIRNKKKIALYSLLAFLPFLMWNIRSIAIAGKWKGIHPIYSVTNNSLYRPSHEKMTDLFRIWENQGDVFHTTVGILAYDTSSLSVDRALNNIPQKYKLKVKPIFEDYHKLWKYHLKNFSEEDEIQSYYKGELEFGKKIDKLRTELIQENRLDYYLITPVKSFAKLVISSHLNLKIFQADLRGTFLGEILRWMSLLVLLATYFFSSIYLFKFKLNPFTFLAIGVCCSFFYLAYVQRMNEERYLTPILPIALVLVGAFFANTKSDDTDSEFEKSV